MMKMCLRVAMFSVLLSLFNVNVFATNSQHTTKKAKTNKPSKIKQISDQSLLKENDSLYQMWSLARNYQYGTTVEKDPIKALAWQLIYLDALPKNYPGKSKSLKSYKQGLSTKQVAQARQYAKGLKKQYHLNFRLTESELSKAFRLKAKSSNNKKNGQQSGLVGQIKPANLANKVNILLRLNNASKDVSPWMSHVVPLTVLANGQFYVNGLKPADYELIISQGDGKKIQKNVTLSPGGVKTLAAIDMTKATA